MARPSCTFPPRWGLECVSIKGSVPSPTELRDNFRLQPGDLVVVAGQALELDCVPPAGQPEPKVTWRKDGVTLRLAGGRHQLSRGKLRVALARRSDAGVYVCVAANAAGERHSRGAHVTILGKLQCMRVLGMLRVTSLISPPCREARHRAAAERCHGSGRQHGGAELWGTG
uniref:Ig-like domain-containing protein n=1 Tax=Coturnix japonica TaxID=93934 RepID=A0A8C2SYK3_COTJA